MTQYQISFDSPSFHVTTLPQLQIGLRLTQGNVAFRGLSPMAYTTNTAGDPFRIEIEGFGAPPKNNPVALPVDLPLPVWTGFDEAVVTFAVATDARSVNCLLTGTAGTFTVTCTVPGLAPATIEIVVEAEALDHIELKVVPIAPPV